MYKKKNYVYFREIKQLQLLFNQQYFKFKIVYFSHHQLNLNFLQNNHAVFGQIRF